MSYARMTYLFTKENTPESPIDAKLNSLYLRIPSIPSCINLLKTGMFFRAGED